MIVAKRRKGPKRQAYLLRELHSDLSEQLYHQLLTERDAKDVQRLLNEWMASGKILQYTFQNVDRGEVPLTLPIAFPVGGPVKQWLAVNLDTGYTQMTDDPAAAAASFDFMIGSPGLSDAMLLEFSVPTRPSIPSIKVVGVKSKGYVLGPWEKTKKKLDTASKA